jgi:hypothetical protein
MVITNHAENRLKERSGLGKKSQERIVAKVLKEGITHSQTKGSLKKWVDSLYFRNKNANNIRLYGDKAYIFCNEVLVTVLQIPANLTKNINKIKNK